MTRLIVDKTETELLAAIDVARQFASKVRSCFGKQVKDIRLYGSAARGDWTTESDVDILVLMHHVSSDDADRVSRLAFHLGPVETGVLLRPLVMDVSRFEMLRQRERRIALDIDLEGEAL